MRVLGHSSAPRRKVCHSSRSSLFAAPRGSPRRRQLNLARSTWPDLKAGPNRCWLSAGAFRRAVPQLSALDRRLFNWQAVSRKQHRPPDNFNVLWAKSRLVQKRPRVPLNKASVSSKQCPEKFGIARQRAEAAGREAEKLRVDFAEISAQIESSVGAIELNAQRQIGSVSVAEVLEKSGSALAEVSREVSTISDLTSLLALNAALAGDHARGFSIVADEVRALAEDSEANARQVEIADDRRRMLAAKAELSYSTSIAASTAARCQAFLRPNVSTDHYRVGFAIS
jgi:Methyl-accepting chemotaxis protein (MCP) signalling domain